MSATCASRFVLGQGVKLVITFIMITLLFRLQPSEMAALCTEIPKREITCHAGTFFAGQNASVSCNFPTDVAADEDNVIVSRLPVNASKDAILLDILECGWKHVKQPYDCRVEKGFRFRGVISYHLTFHIPDVGIDKAGMYMCFIVSSDIPSAECELIVKDYEPPSTDTRNEISTPHPSLEKGDGNHTVLIAILVVMSLIILAGLIIVAIIVARRHFTRTRQVQRNRQVQRKQSDPMSTHLLTTTDLPNDKVLEILKSVELTTPDCEQLMESLQTEIGDFPCLPFVDDDDPNKIMYSVPMNCLPTETVTEGDDVTVVEISSTVIRIHEVRLLQFETRCTYYPIPKEVILGTDIRLLDFIADCAKEFYRGKFQRQKLFLGFVFSFPLEYQHDLNEARFTAWNSGFRWDHLGDENVQDLLCDAFRRKHRRSRLKVTFILNNAAGTLLSVLNKDRHCRIGVSLADGFHACYLHKGENMMISNIVLGALGKNGCLKKFITDYDKKLDLHSIHRGQQILGKMVSMAYIGEIVRLVLTTLAEKNLLFSSDVRRSLLNTKGSFTADHVSQIESEKSEQCMLTENVIKLLEIKHYTKEDFRTVGYVVRTVLKRAAHLAATVLAVLVNQTDIPKVTIAVDGNLRRNHPIFFGLLRDKTQELIKSEKEVEFKEQLDGSAIGAALAVNVLKSSHTA